MLVASFLVLCSGGVASADQNDPPPTPQQARPAPDFLFGQPRGSIGVRGSWVFARTGSDLFEFVQQQLTIDKRDFNAPAFAVDVGVAVSPRVDVVFGFEYSQAGMTSEYRDFVDNNRQPITQDTDLRQADLRGSVRFALAPWGRSVSRLAWIPRRVVPYAGAGGGVLWYRFQQQGDFIDVFSTRRTVFRDTLSSRGWTPSAHVFGGVDIRVARRLFVATEGRYLWASASLQRSYEGFDPIDLAGFRLSSGINVLF
ncbi:MAG: hypothetical protein ACRD3C_17050 [Vicinamibacterales bacterium]